MADVIGTPERVRSHVSRRSELGRPQYRGATYYAQPVIKASPWTWLVPAYVFLAGLAGAAQILAALAHFGGGWRRRSIVRNGRLVGFAGSLVGPLLLIFDLKTPDRFHNMLRIFRSTSPLSLGSYVLTLFGVLSAATAAAETASSRTHATATAGRSTGSRSSPPWPASCCRAPPIALTRASTSMHRCGRLRKAPPTNSAHSPSARPCRWPSTEPTRCGGSHRPRCRSPPRSPCSLAVPSCDRPSCEPRRPRRSDPRTISD